MLLKVVMLEEIQTEYRMSEIRFSRAQKLHVKVSSKRKVQRFIHKEEWNKYSRKEPTCVALAAFQALDPKKQLKMACVVFEMSVANDRRNLARDFRENAVEHRKITRDEAHKKIFQSQLDLIRIKDKVRRRVVQSTVTVVTVNKKGPSKRPRAQQESAEESGGDF